MYCGFWHAGETKGRVPSGNAWGSGRRARSRPWRGSSAWPFFCLFWPPNPYSLGQSISLTHALIFFIYIYLFRAEIVWVTWSRDAQKHLTANIWAHFFTSFFYLPFFLFTPQKPYCTLCSPPVSEWLKCPSLQSEALWTLYCLVAVPGVFVQWCHPGIYECTCALTQPSPLSPLHWPPFSPPMIDSTIPLVLVNYLPWCRFCLYLSILLYLL